MSKFVAEEKCEFKDRCGSTGHYYSGQSLIRCPCLVRFLNRRRLGKVYSSNPKESTKLKVLKDQNLLIQGTLSEIKAHISGALREDDEFVAIDAYRLIEIFLEKDIEFDKLTQISLAPLTILFLGFSDPRNSYLPDLINQLFSRRELEELPTWVVLGIEINQVSGRYDQAVRDKLDSFRKVSTK